MQAARGRAQPRDVQLLPVGAAQRPRGARGAVLRGSESRRLVREGRGPACPGAHRVARAGVFLSGQEALLRARCLSRPPSGTLYALFDCVSRSASCLLWRADGGPLTLHPLLPCEREQLPRRRRQQCVCSWPPSGCGFSILLQAHLRPWGSGRASPLPQHLPGLPGSSREGSKLPCLALRTLGMGTPDPSPAP